ncbi:unnamed protein product, partial [Mesorhabditis spiculigera]
MLRVTAGVNKNSTINDACVLFVGKRNNVKKLDPALAIAKLGGVANGGEMWEGALNAAYDEGSSPIYLNRAKVITVPETVSRGNAPSNSVAIFREVKKNVPSSAMSLSVVLVAEYADVVAQVAAIARAFPKYSLKTKPETLEEINIEVVVVDGELSSSDVEYLNSLSTAIRETQRLIDTPANFLTTDALVEEAIKLAGELPGVTHELIRGEDLLHQGFGGIYHVGKAGPTPPAFVVLSHKPAGSNHTYALVGKGIVYDTGGMQIKGKTGMPNMKRDMGGAAGMLHAFATLVRAGFKQELHVLLCIAENNVSPIANKPDDIIRMLSGKTVEINNTDAEGRLVLADGVFYAKERLNAGTIIDMATLTGAQSYVTGKLHAALLTNLETSEHEVEAAGKRSGDMVKSMLFAPDLHFGDLKSPVADMRNSNLGKMQGPPSAIAGLFIGSHIDFGEGLNWIHLDIAAPAEVDDRATGYGPSLLSVLLGKETTVPLLQ